MNLSFRVQSIGCVGGAAFVLFALVCLVGPAAYLAWYIVSGAERSTPRQIATLAQRSPVQDAQDAANRGDYRFFTVPRGLDSHVPGVGVYDTQAAHGYRSMPYFVSDKPTADQQRSNALAEEYARQYNVAMQAAAPPEAYQPRP